MGNKYIFNMGNEFNGYSEQTHLKGTQRNYNPALPQDNVKLKPDFTQLLPKSNGGIAAVQNAVNQNNTLYYKSTGGLSQIRKMFIHGTEPW